jgi:hypothetical protein
VIESAAAFTFGVSPTAIAVDVTDAHTRTFPATALSTTATPTIGFDDGVLAQVTRVLSGSCDSAERRMDHHNRGCCLATIISCLPVVGNMKEEGDDSDRQEAAKRKRDG